MDILPKKIYKYKISTIKIFNITIIKICKFKQQWISVYTSLWLKLKIIVAIPSAGEDEEKLIIHTFLVGLYNGKLLLSYKTKHVTTTWPTNCTLELLSLRNKNLCSIKTCTQLCIADLFIIAKKWKQYRYSSMGD